jgi:DNA polymerase-3 subunit epsilon
VKVDSFSLLQAISYLVSRLSDEFEVREVRFRLSRRAPGAPGPHLVGAGDEHRNRDGLGARADDLRRRELALTVRDVIARHDGEIWLQREKTQHRAFFRLLLPSAAPQEQVEAGLS